MKIFSHAVVKLLLCMECCQGVLQMKRAKDPGTCVKWKFSFVLPDRLSFTEDVMFTNTDLETELS